MSKHIANLVEFSTFHILSFVIIRPHNRSSLVIFLLEIFISKAVSLVKLGKSAVFARMTECLGIHILGTTCRVKLTNPTIEENWSQFY